MFKVGDIVVLKSCPSKGPLEVFAVGSLGLLVAGFGQRSAIFVDESEVREA